MKKTSYILLLLIACVPCFTRAQGIISTIAGNGITQYIGDGTPATAYSLGLPSSIFVDKSGNVFVADNMNQRIRKLTPAGTLSTLAGNGTTGYSGDGGPASAAILNMPNGICGDTSGNLYITEYYNKVVRKINAATGIITTVCGNGGGGFSGDGGPATSAHLETPHAAIVDAAGNIYIPDYGNHRVRKVTAATGIISTIAGTGVNGYTGDGGLATNAQLSYPSCLCFDTAGNLFFTETGNNVIRRIDAITGIITTVAGTGANGYSGDGGACTAATFNQPNGVFVDKKGNVYVSDYGNNVIRGIAPNGIIKTIAGTGTYAYTGDGGLSTSATFYDPNAVFVDNAGFVYISDGGNSVIRKITPPMSGIQEEAVPFFSIYPNPTSGNFIMKTPVAVDGEVVIFDVGGRKVYGNTINGSSHEINLAEQPAGIYFIQMVTAHKMFVNKLILSK
jgi:streptogramin lyase